MNKLLLTLLFVSILYSCSVNSKVNAVQSASEKLIAKCIEEHGGKAYEKNTYSFDFREKSFQFKFDEVGDFSYQSVYTKDDQEWKIIDTNDNLEILVDGQIKSLSEKQVNSHKNSLNSVIYFATLPYKLSDKAVNSRLLDDQKINGTEYYQVEVTFQEDGGGQDHDDVFHYWINKQTKQMEFLAYVYHTGKGGVRFREAFNSRKVEGVIFQDYRNYKASLGTDLRNLPTLFQTGSLTLLSEILTENVELVK